MSYKIDYSPSADKTIKKWKKSNKNLYKKFEKLLSELAEHPRIGTGHPEPLAGGEGNIYFRHITAHDRIIYRIYDDIVVVLIITIEGHYDDK